MSEDERSNEVEAGRSAHLTEKTPDRQRVPVWVLVIIGIALVLVWDFWPYLVKDAKRAQVLQICQPGTLWGDAERELASRGFNTRPASPPAWQQIDWGRCYTAHLLYKALRFVPDEHQFRLMTAYPVPLMIYEVDTTGTIVRHVKVLNTL